MEVKKKVKISRKKKDATGKQFEVVELNPSEINIGWRARSDFGDINDLASSISKFGQIHPIRVVKNGEDKPTLVAGYRRVRACTQLGIKVRAEVVALQDAVLELGRQLDENLKRKDFDVLERSEGMARLKEEYEKLYPETKLGATGGGLKGKGTKRKTDIALAAKPAPRFTIKASQTFGCSERHVQELLEISKLPRKYKQRIDAAKTTAERNQIARECLAKVRQDRRVEQLQKQIDAKKQKSIDEQLEDIQSKPSIVLHYGDNRDFLKGEELYEVIITDPPYDRERSLISHAVRASINPKQFQWDKIGMDWVIRAAPMLTKGGQMLVFCPLEAIGTYELICQAVGLEYRQALIWFRSNPTSAHKSGYANAAQAIIWAVKPGGKPYFDVEEAKAGASRVNVFTGPAKNRIHETQKPEWLISQLLKAHAHPGLGHRILDPFAGSGTTGVVCSQLGLACTMIESNEDYVKKARLRLDAV